MLLYNKCYKGGEPMPRKPRITRDMVIEAAFEVAREEGYESINARRVAERLGCSTQPVMYHFSTMESLKREAYDKADAMHTEYLLNVPGDTDPMLAIGLNYIRFAVQEKNLILIEQHGYVFYHFLFT